MSYTNECLIEIRQNEKGKAAYSRTRIYKGDVIGCFDGMARAFELMVDGSVDYGPFNRSQAVEVACYNNSVIALVPDLDQPLSGVDFINHSCNPNCQLDGYILVVAAEDITPATELTINYQAITLIPENKPCLCQIDCTFVL